MVGFKESDLLEYKSDSFKINDFGFDSEMSIPLDLKRQEKMRKKIFNGIVKGLEKEGVVIHDEPKKVSGRINIKY